jgi:hypothetical protein
MRSLRIATLALAVGALIVVPVHPGMAAGPEGCVVTNPPNGAYSNPCTYKATVPGGIVGGGGFKVVIKRGKKKIVLTDAKSDNYDIGTIHPRDKVTATAVGPMSFVAVGNPCPTSIPGGC